MKRLKESNIKMEVSRRSFLNHMFGSAVALAAPAILTGAPALAYSTRLPSRAAAYKERRVRIMNVHTNDRVDQVYWRNGQYDRWALDNIQFVMRDWRNNKMTNIDYNLLDVLFSLSVQLDARNEEFHLVSGYRSPETNNMLRKKSSGVAKFSLHMKGMASDIFLPGAKLSTLRNAAMDIKMGGVGYYPRSGFVHVDSGKFRSWG